MDDAGLRRIIGGRRTLRSYAPTPLTLEEVSYLLWCTQGVTEVAPGVRTTRTVPSAGARHAFETSVLVNRVQGLGPGLYRFSALEHALTAARAEAIGCASAPSRPSKTMK